MKRTTSKKQAKKPPSDTPTTAIAPSDYEHIFSSKEQIKKPAQGNSGGSSSPPSRPRRKPPSDTPTTAIAPSDYEHIFSSKEQLKKSTKPSTPPQVPVERNFQSNAPPKTSPKRRKPPSDTPTTAIAPSDYEHIFSSKEKIKESAAASKGSPSNGTSGGSSPPAPRRPRRKPPSDTPTTAIAPSDYEHIFSSKEQLKKSDAKQDATDPPVSQGFDFFTSPKRNNSYRPASSGRDPSPPVSARPVSRPQRPPAPTRGLSKDEHLSFTGPQARMAGSDHLPEGIKLSLNRFLASRPKTYQVSEWALKYKPKRQQ